MSARACMILEPRRFFISMFVLKKRGDHWKWRRRSSKYGAGVTRETRRLARCRTLETRGTRAPRVPRFVRASLSSLPFNQATTSSTQLLSSTPKAPYISSKCKGLLRSYDISGRRSLALSSGKGLLSKRDLRPGKATGSALAMILITFAWH